VRDRTRILPSALIVLIRHEECQKTLSERFGEMPGDTITPAGRRRAMTIGRALQQYAKRKSWGIELHCASSDRAHQTAAIIQACAAVPIITLRIVSIDLGPVSGRTAVEITQRFPRFAEALSLYRAGLFNSYDLPFPKGAQSAKGFECHAFEIFRRAIKRSRRELLVFVLHRSPITAILISIARQMRVYPRQFYGVVPMLPGGCFLIQSSGGKLKLLKANVQPDKLASALAEIKTLRNC
jgi:broad specificity phosphatase PhoE